jgi:hypothetical protein
MSMFINVQSGIPTIPLFAMLLATCGSVSAGSPITMSPQAPQLLPPELAAYSKARTVVELTNAELLQEFPEDLAGLEFDKDHEPLTQLLSRVGEKVATLFLDYPKTTSKEQVRREVLGRDDRVEDSVTQNYYYSVYPRELGLWEEARTDNRGHPIPPERMRGSSLLTSGFASVGIFFHPIHQVGSSYRYLGRQPKEPYSHVIAFAQRPGIAQVTGSFTSDSMLLETSILFQGIAWIDPISYQIVRMRTDLLAPRPDVMLYQQTTEVWFSEVHFGATRQAFWVPREVVVTIWWSNMKYRNRHRYSDHQIFMVETQEKIELPKIKKHHDRPGPQQAPAAGWGLNKVSPRAPSGIRRPQ